MSVRSSCGHDNQLGAKFCSECGARLVQPQPVTQAERKIVTVLFADLVGFTSRAEQLDPEDVRAVLSPYHVRLRSELERFGGTVEKFIGDAVMALFGAPMAHEDDPERAVRAALAIRDWAGEEGKIEVRIGVATGEALITLGARPEQGEGMAAGDVVNTAARLQAAAPVNGILVGERTFRATRSVIDYREAGPVAAKGKKFPVLVWEALATRVRLGVDVADQGRAVLVGRDRELGVLIDVLARVRAECRPQLVTLVGVPGIGKSRLLFELRKVTDAEPGLISWRQGRSLPYGEGMSFWALAEIVKAQAGILETDTAARAGAKMAQMVADVMDGAVEAGWVARHLGVLAGLGNRTGGGVAGGDRRGEMFAAWRQFVEALAESRPLVLVFEDLHWADEGLLDFVDYLADWADEVPLLVIGTARPELLARRPGWGGGKSNAVTLSLVPLSEADTARLIDLLADRPALEAGRQAVLLERAGGNPLYAEQYVQMLADQQAAQTRGQALPVPETVQAIIAARLDLLAPVEKRLLHNAAVIGKVFWTGAVAVLGGTPGGEELDKCLHSLGRRQFIRRERASSVADQTQYAFVHVLARDVAYGQIPRRARAEQHARAAGWIESLGRTEDHAEMLAHHYMRALELARAVGRDTADLAPRAQSALQAAGDRAFALNAFAPAAEYYRAALSLLPDNAQVQRAGLLRQVGTILYETGDRREAEAVLTEGAEVAAAVGLSAERARMGVLLAEIHNLQGRPFSEVMEECKAATAVLDSEGDLEGLAEAWLLVGKLRFFRGEAPADQQAVERALTYARQSGSRRAQIYATTWLVATLATLHVPADTAVARAEQLREEVSGDPLAEAAILDPLAVLYAYVGRFADARAAIARQRSVFASFGATPHLAEGAFAGGEVELAAGNPAAAERHLREAYETFRAIGERGTLSTTMGMLAEAVYLQGRFNDAQQLTEEAESLALGDDVDGQARWRATRAKVLARRGQFAAARRLADDAITLVSETSYKVLRAQVLRAKAEVDGLAGARDQAEASLRAALRIYQDGHAVSLADQAKSALTEFITRPGAKLPGH